MSGPVPSNLFLLSELPRCAPGTKVRFLGCVDEYILKDARLRLKHNYPANSTSIVANVDIEHVLEQIKRREVDVGAWINVIGYVESCNEDGVFVQAVIVWEAGEVDLDAYEKAVEQRRASQ